MAIEQKWPVVAPQLFTADGGAQGQITVADVRGFKVKQFVVIKATAQPDIRVQVKRVTKKTGKIIVGPPSDQQTQGKAGLRTTTDLTAYTLLAGAFLYAEEQDKVKVKPDDQDIATYEQEPTVARRVVQVDQFGDFYDGDNPMPIAIDGTIVVGNVTIQDDDGDELEINPDGSINVNVVVSPVSGHEVKSIYNQILSVASGATTVLITYTVPAGKTAVLQRISVSGENIGRYDVLLNNALFDTRRTMFGADLTTDFDYTSGNNDGITFVAGDVIKIQVLHNRPMAGAFNARLQILEIA